MLRICKVKPSCFILRPRPSSHCRYKLCTKVKLEKKNLQARGVTCNFTNTLHVQLDIGGGMGVIKKYFASIFIPPFFDKYRVFLVE